MPGEIDTAGMRSLGFVQDTAGRWRDLAGRFATHERIAAAAAAAGVDVEVTLKWHGRKAVEHVVSTLSKRVNAAGRYLVNFLREKLSIAYPPSSAPGEYPHKRTGHGRANVVQEHDPQICVSRVGTNVVYMKNHELGTMGRGRRPWLSTGMTECRPALKSIIESGAVP